MLQSQMFNSYDEKCCFQQPFNYLKILSSNPTEVKTDTREALGLGSFPASGNNLPGNSYVPLCFFDKVASLKLLSNIIHYFFGKFNWKVINRYFTRGLRISGQFLSMARSCFGATSLWEIMKRNWKLFTTFRHRVSTDTQDAVSSSR